MLHSLKNVHGFEVLATDGTIGRVKDFYFDDSTWFVRFFVVETGDWLSGRRVLVATQSVHDVDWQEHRLQTGVTLHQVMRSPNIDTMAPVSQQHAVQQYEYYGYPYELGGPGVWGFGPMPTQLAAGYGSAGPSTPLRQEKAFVLRQAQRHLDRGDDPHLRGYRAVDRFHVRASDGDIGHVEGLIVDDDDWAIRYLVVNTSDWWIGHVVLLAPQWIADVSWLEATVTVDLTQLAVRNAPAYDEAHLPDRVHEVALYRHHDRTAYWIDVDGSVAQRPKR
jgi:hypothetical protein